MSKWGDGSKERQRYKGWIDRETELFRDGETEK